MYVCIYVCVYVCVCVCVCMCVCMCVCVCMYVCMYVCMKQLIEKCLDDNFKHRIRDNFVQWQYHGPEGVTETYGLRVKSDVIAKEVRVHC